MAESPEGLKERMDERFDDVDRRFGEVDRRMDERFDRVTAEMKAGFSRMDERFGEMDERFGEMNHRFERTEGEIAEIRVAIKDLHEDNKATLRVMNQGFLTFAAAIVAACGIVAGVNAL